MKCGGREMGDGHQQGSEEKREVTGRNPGSSQWCQTEVPSAGPSSGGGGMGKEGGEGLASGGCSYSLECCGKGIISGQALLWIRWGRGGRWGPGGRRGS